MGTFKDKKFLFWTGLNFALSFMFCIFAPIDAYYANMDEYWFNFGQVVSVCSIVFLLLFVVLTVISFFLCKTKVADTIFATFWAFYSYFYIQGNYIPRKYGVLDGKTIDWNAYSGYGIASVVVFILCAAIAVLVYAKFRKQLYKFGFVSGIFITLIQVITIITLMIQNGFGTSVKEIATVRNFYDVSSDHNVIVFLLDKYDGADLTYNLDKDYDTHADIFENFTFYPDSLGGYPTTKASMPLILTGKWYENDVPFADYVERSYVDNPIYQAFEANNYQIDMYTDTIFLNPDDSMYSNVEYGEYHIKNNVSFLKQWFKIIAFNYMPHQLKALFFTDTSAFDNLKATNLEYYSYTADDIIFTNSLMNNGLTVNRTGNVFKFYHLNGCHEPYTFGADLIEDGGNYNCYDEACGNDESLRRYFQALKDLGLYDSSTIIVIADHGQFGKCQNPILLIKNANEHHEFTISDAEMSWEYLQDVWVALANGNTVDEGFIRDLREAYGPRRFLYYTWDDAWARSYMPGMEEMTNDGHAWDVNTLHFTGESYYADTETHTYHFGDNLQFTDGRSGYSHVLYGVFYSKINHEAKMVFDFEEDYDNVNVEITVGNGNQGRRVDFYANGNLVTSRSFIPDSPDDNKLIVTIPHEYIDNGHLELVMVQGAVGPDSKVRESGNTISQMTLYSTTDAPVAYDAGQDYAYIPGTEMGLVYGRTNGERYIVDGLSYLEGDGARFVDNEANLRFEANEVFSDLYFTVKYTSLDEDTVIDVYCNDTYVSEFVASGDDRHAVLLPYDLIKDGSINIRLCLPNKTTEDILNGSDGQLKIQTLNLSYASYLYVPGTTVNFVGNNTNYAPYFMSGLSISENFGTWSSGSETSFRFKLREVPSEVLLSVDFGTFDGTQNILVYCNDVLIDNVTARGDGNIKTTIPDELKNSEYLDIRFEFPNAHSPFSVDPSNPDTREMAVYFKSLTLYDASLYRNSDTSILGRVMNWCYNLVGDYGWAIVLFTFLTKIILLPLSMWTYYNGITMIKIQPDINFIKAKYYGQKDVIADEQAKLFKEKKYRPMASVVPTVVQLILLMGVVDAIKAGIANPIINMYFYGVNLGNVPSDIGIKLIWSPIVAGLAAFVLCIAQNASNVLQAEQSKANKWGMTVFSVGLSLYLGWFVSVGTAFYWVASNLFAVVQLYICNWIIKPRKYIDYERLEKSREELAALQGVGGEKKKDGFFSENRRRERIDYKRYFNVVNKHLTFYSESNGFYKYYKGIIEYLLANTKLRIHYITSDPNDNIFAMAQENPRIRAYYIGENKLITLMMKMDCDVVCMTMPDLDNFHIKRSYVRDDVEYIFIPHGMGSSNLTMRRGSTDHFDTVFLAGTHQRDEEERIGEVYSLKPRTLVDVGYPLIDEIRSKFNATEHKPNERKKILIAPSWQKDNIVDSCLEELLDFLKDKGYQIIVRPHPQEVRHKKEYMENLKEKYKAFGIEVQTDFSSDNPLLESDILITDWSDIAWEFSFTTLRPVLFINTPMKVMNPEYEKIGVEPFNVTLKDQVGRSVDLDKLHEVVPAIEYLIEHTDDYKTTISELANKHLYNLDNSSEAAGKYIVDTLLKKIAKRRGNKDEKNN